MDVYYFIIISSTRDFKSQNSFAFAKHIFLAGGEADKPSSWELEVGRKEANAKKSRSHHSCLIKYYIITDPPFSGFVVLSLTLEDAH